VWESDSGKLLATLQGHQGPIRRAQFSPDGERIVTASEDGTARVWENSTGKLLATLQGHQGGVGDAQFSPNGRRIVTASEDNTARVWESASGKLLTTLKGHQYWVANAQFSPDGRRIVTASEDGTARVWESESGKLLGTLEGGEDRPPLLDALSSAEFSPNGQRILTASVKAVRVWESDSGRLLAAFPLNGNIAHWSPNGQCILTTEFYDPEARVLETFPFKNPPPAWFVSFLECLAQRRLNQRGELEDIPAPEWLAVRDQVEKAASSDTSRYGQLARWFLISSEQRPVRPGAKITQHQVADELLYPGATRGEVERAYELWPAHPLVHIALAAFQQAPDIKDNSELQRRTAQQANLARADFLRRYDLQRLPSDPVICRRAAQMLRDQRQDDLAREAEIKVTP
jgi:dipeptidyl aminopeptidase/acylaminoacyl peptidase